MLRPNGACHTHAALQVFTRTQSHATGWKVALLLNANVPFSAHATCQKAVMLLNPNVPFAATPARGLHEHDGLHST